MQLAFTYFLILITVFGSQAFSRTLTTTVSEKIVNSWEILKENCPERCECSMKMSEHFQAFLRTVDCSEQGLFEIPSEIPSDVQVLLLRDNKIRHLFEKPWGLRDLVHLDLSHNLIHTIHGNFRELYNLKILDLSHNRLTTVQDHFFRGLYNLQELNIADNQISILMDDFLVGLPKIEILRLSGNRLDYVHSAWWANVRSLYNLHLDRNKFSLIQAEAFKGLTNLKKLDLGKNKLEGLNFDALKGMERLEILNLDYNFLSRVPRETLNHVSSTLKSIKLNHNSLETLQTDDFANFPVLKDLNFNNMNRLKLVERGALKNLPQLVLLEMRDNPKLSYIDPLAFVNVPSVSHILLHNNNLTILSENILKLSKELQEISFYGNPLLCDCNMKWLIHYLTQPVGSIIFRDAERMVCDAPSMQRFKLFATVPKDSINDQCPPWIVPLFNTSIDKKVGEDVMLSCHAVGIPAPKITWLDPDGIVITSSAYHPRRVLQNGQTLTIHQVQQDDQGRYTCVAENSMGRHVMHANLNITSVQIQLSVTSVKDRSAILRWQKDEYIAKRVFQILYRQLDSNIAIAGRRHDYAGAVSAIMQHYRLENLKPMTNYEACVAYKDDFDVVVHISCVQFETSKPFDIAEQAGQQNAVAGERFSNLAVGIALSVVAAMLIIVGLTAVIFATKSNNNFNMPTDLYDKCNSSDNTAYTTSSTDNLSRTFSTENMVSPLVYNKLVSISKLHPADHV